MIGIGLWLRKGWCILVEEGIVDALSGLEWVWCRCRT